MVAFYKDRKQAGRVLARELSRYAGRDDLLVLALPRGGVPVALEIATALGAPLDVLLVRKLSAPGQPELAMVAVASADVLVVNPDIVEALNVSEADICRAAERERDVIRRREALYRDGWVAPDVPGRLVILVDDGIATGATTRAAIAAIRQRRPARLVLAVPVAPPLACRELAGEVDEVVCPCTPEPFYAIGQHYRDFPQVEDDEVVRLLAEGRRVYELRHAERCGAHP